MHGLKTRATVNRKAAMNRVVILLFVVVSANLSFADSPPATITLATYNIELFHTHFAASSQPVKDPEVLTRLRNDADKDFWMISEVIKNPKMNPDILCVEECCEQTELEKFN